MRRFWFTILIIALLGTVPAAAYYWWLSQRLPPSKDMQGLEYALRDSTYHDIVVVGASKVEVNIDPRIVDSITGKNSYMLNVDGIGILEYNMLLRMYLRNHPPPKYVLINTEDNIYDTHGRLFNTPDYFPYLEDTAIYKLLAPYNPLYRDKFAQLRMQVKRLFATTDTRRMHALSPRLYNRFYGDMKWPYYKGYRNVTLDWIPGSEPPYRQHIGVREEGFELLKGMIRLCQSKNIEVVLFYSPQHDIGKDVFLNHDAIVKRTQAIADSLNVQLWSYWNHPITHDKKYFYNYAHLNRNGAIEFSHAFANDLKAFIQQRETATHQGNP